MKKVSSKYAFQLILLVLFIGGCVKEKRSSGSGTGTNPGTGTSDNTVKYTPVAFAGNDTTIYAPFSIYSLNSNGTTDRDNNIVSFAWRFLSGPSTVTIAKPAGSSTNVSGLVFLGVYSFELAVTDSHNLTGRDTVKVTVGDPTCIGVLKEIVLSNITWNFAWIMDYQIVINDLLPPHSKVKNISIKRDNSNIWELVVPFNDFAPDYRFHTWAYGYGIMEIYPSESNKTNDTPDLKIEYCN